MKNVRNSSHGRSQGVPKIQVAAPDHKIRQCIQRSALFPGRADGGAEGPEFWTRARRGRREAPQHQGVRSGKGRRSPSSLGDLGFMPPEKNQKST